MMVISCKSLHMVLKILIKYFSLSEGHIKAVNLVSDLEYMPLEALSNRKMLKLIPILSPKTK